MGIDFLLSHQIQLQFHQQPNDDSAGFKITWPEPSDGAVASVSIDDAVTECEARAVVPWFTIRDEAHELPTCPTSYRGLLNTFGALFRLRPGSTDLIYYHIPTGNSMPVRVPARRIHIILAQLRTMLEQGIIWPSSSSWLALAVYTPGTCVLQWSTGSSISVR